MNKLSPKQSALLQFWKVTAKLIIFGYPLLSHFLQHYSKVYNDKCLFHCSMFNIIIIIIQTLLNKNTLECKNMPAQQSSPVQSSLVFQIVTPSLPLYCTKQQLYADQILFHNTSCAYLIKTAFVSLVTINSLYLNARISYKEKVLMGKCLWISQFC